MLDGRVIGLISPGWAASPVTIASFSETVSKKGGETKIFGMTCKNDRTFAGSDAERAAHISAALYDPEVHIVLCSRGGYGCTRTLDHLAGLKFESKPLVGYSDATSLLLHLIGEGFVQAFHGPMMSDIVLRGCPKSLQWLLEILAGERSDYEFKPGEFEFFKSGSASGILFGGNLTVLESLIGTPTLKVPHGCILLIEDYQERYTSIDRSLIHLKQTGLLSRANGLLFGSMDLAAHETNKMHNETIEYLLNDHFRDFQGPIAFGLPFGHCDTQMTIPLGVSARLQVDPDRFSLEFQTRQETQSSSQGYWSK